MKNLIFIFGLLDAFWGLFIVYGTVKSDDSKSSARLGATVMAILLLGSAALLAQFAF